MAHKHWAEDHPWYDRAPACDLPTMKACDKRWTTYLHGHLGEPCRKEVKPGNVLATCVLIQKDQAKRDVRAVESQRREAVYTAFIDSEVTRIASLL